MKNWRPEALTQSWWFQLYTLPFLSKVMSKFYLVLMLDLVANYFTNGSLSFLFLLYLWALKSAFAHKDQISFRNNIEFHKLHVPFPELRRALLGDIAIRAVAISIFIIAAYYLSYVAKGSFVSIFAEADIPPYHFVQLLYFIMLMVVFYAWISIFNKEEKYTFMGIRRSDRFLYYLMSFGAFVIMILGFILLASLGFNFIMSCSLMMGVIGVTSLMYHFKALFHQTPATGSFKNLLRFGVPGSLGFMLVFVLLSSLVRNAPLDRELPASQRMEAFYFLGPLAAPLDLESFKVIEPLSLDFSMLLFRRISFDRAELELEFFLEEGDSSHRLHRWLKYGKPSQDFLFSVYRDLSQRPDYWQKKPGHASIILASRKAWPKQQEFPQEFHHLDRRAQEIEQERKRLPASN
jgi:hypothetical protein